MSNEPVKFSVIIPVRTINDYVRENIEYIKKLDYPDFEVLIITDSPEEYPFDDHRFILLSSGSVGPGEKRNIGAREAQGEILAFLDDDACPRSDWLSKAFEIFDSADIYALGAPAITFENAPLLEKLSGRVYESYLTCGNTVYRYLPKSRREVKDYPTVNLFVKKRIFDEVGGFPIEFWPGEDTKLCLDLVEKTGKPFIYDPAPIVYHHRRNIFLPHLKQVSRYGRHRGQFARIFPETSRLPFYFVPSIFILGLIAGPLISVLIPFLWNIYFAILGVYLLLVLVESARIALLEKSIFVFLYSVVSIFLTHLVYGVNFIWGYLKRPALKLRDIDESTGTYVGG